MSPATVISTLDQRQKRVKVIRSTHLDSPPASASAYIKHPSRIVVDGGKVQSSTLEQSHQMMD
jgi:hypothetical protein